MDSSNRSDSLSAQGVSVATPVEDSKLGDVPVPPIKENTTRKEANVDLLGQLKASSPCTFALLLGSIVVLLEACHVCSDLNNASHNHHHFGCSKEWTVIWSFICSALSCVALLYLILPTHTSLKIPLCTFLRLKHISYFFLILWTLGTGCFTFDKPFANPGNGYFASWLCFIASLALSIQHIPFMKAKITVISKSIQTQWFALIAFASAINLVSAAVFCGNSHHCTGYEAWAVACSCISFVVSLTVTFFQGKSGADKKRNKFVSVFLFMLWIAGCGVMTMKGPFRSVGNGYISCWIALLTSMQLLAEHLNIQLLPSTALAMFANQVKEIADDEDESVP